MSEFNTTPARKQNKMSLAGVYKITNSITGDTYIGSSKNPHIRKNDHFACLVGNKHPNAKLQRAFNKYGREVFSFEILANCPPEYCLKLEQWFLDTQKPKYNIAKIAGSPPGNAKNAYWIQVGEDRIIRTEGLSDFAQMHDIHPSSLYGTVTSYRFIKGFSVLAITDLLATECPVDLKPINPELYFIQMPSKEIIAVAEDELGEFCNANKLTMRFLKQTLEGRVKQHKKFLLLGKSRNPDDIGLYQLTCNKKTKKPVFEYVIQLPNGEIERTGNLKQFCTKNNLHQITLGQTLLEEGWRGYKITQHKGFKLLSKTPL